MFDLIIEHSQSIMNIRALLFILGGVSVGLVAGALPGLTPPIAVALLLPLTFGLDPVMSLAALGAIYMAAEYSGSIPAILLNTPGTAAAVCTAFDGYPMAQKGLAQKALTLSIVSSCIGGILGVLVLMFFTPPLAKFSLRFGPPEMFWLAIVGLSIICSLSAKDFIKGVVASCIGLFIATVGYDYITGVPRFNFNIPELEAGVALVPALLGFFSVSQMLNLLGGRSAVIAEIKPIPNCFRQVISFVFARPFLLLRSSIIGVLIGILPGAGASIASFVSYSEAKRNSKNPDAFGQGAPEGIVAAETANNAMVGGSLVPLLALGIPGSPAAAVLFGALTMNGLVAGPQLFVDSPDVAYGFMVSLIPAALCMFAVGSISSRWLALVLKVKTSYIIPAVMALTMLGSYSVRSSVFDIYITAFCGLVGFFMIRMKFPMGPVVLGLILGPMAEQGLRRSLMLAKSHDSMITFLLLRPISMVLMAIAIFLIFTSFYKEFKSNKKQQGQ